MFKDLSWFSVLLGMNFDFEQPTLSREAVKSVELILVNKQKTIKDLMTSLPNHYQYLKEQIYYTS